MNGYFLTPTILRSDVSNVVGVLSSIFTDRVIPFDVDGRANSQGNRASNAGGMLNKFQFSKDAMRR